MPGVSPLLFFVAAAVGHWGKTTPKLGHGHGSQGKGHGDGHIHGHGHGDGHAHVKGMGTPTRALPKENCGFCALGISLLCPYTCSRNRLSISGRLLVSHSFADLIGVPSFMLRGSVRLYLGTLSSL